MNNWKRARLGTAAVLLGGFGALYISAGTASASGGTGHGITITLEFGPNSFKAFDPNSLNPPVGPAFDLSGCPFDDTASFTITGNGEQHGTGSPSGGDWGGETINGSATLNEGGTVAYIGQATGWGGGGNNHSGQAEEGETFHFHGVSTSDGSSLDVALGYHGTLSNGGNLANFSESITCR